VTHGRLIEELDLLAYADDLLDPARREEVETYLRQDLEAAQRVADYRAQNQAIRAAYGHIAAEAPPARLVEVAHRRIGKSRWPSPLKFGAVAAAMAAAGFFGWSLNTPTSSIPQPSDALIEASLALHSDWSPRVETAAEVAADGNSLVPKALAAEPEGELVLRITPPDLSSLGLRLLAMRPTSSQGLEGVQLIYMDAQGERMSLFLLPTAGGNPGPIMVGQGGGGKLAYWRDGPIAFALIGQGASDSAQRVATQVRGSLRSGPGLFIPPEARRGLAAGPSETSGTLIESAPLLPAQPVSNEDPGTLLPERM
jgi:anti-sigma factor RsiW